MSESTAWASARVNCRLVTSGISLTATSVSKYAAEPAVETPGAALGHRERADGIDLIGQIIVCAAPGADTGTVGTTVGEHGIVLGFRLGLRYFGSP